MKEYQYTRCFEFRKLFNMSVKVKIFMKASAVYKVISLLFFMLDPKALFPSIPCVKVKKPDERR